MYGMPEDCNTKDQKPKHKPNYRNAAKQFRTVMEMVPPTNIAPRFIEGKTIDQRPKGGIKPIPTEYEAIAKALLQYMETQLLVSDELTLDRIDPFLIKKGVIKILLEQEKKKDE